MIAIAKVILDLFVLGLFLYSKLLPYKDRLNGQYKGIFNFFSGVFEPVLKFFRSFIKPVKVGTNLSVDMSQIVLLVIFLLIMKFL